MVHSHVQANDSRLDAAMQHSRKGRCVFPVHWITGNGDCSCRRKNCVNPGKHPITPRGLNDATADERRIRYWWTEYPNANIGAATGEISGIIVLDVDADKGGLFALKQLEDKYGKLPETETNRTGGGGFHYVFNHPGYSVKNSVGKIGQGLDIRGDGGYVILPPSNHASGSRYESVTDAEPAELPAWLAKLIEDTTVKQPRLRFTPIIPEGERDDTLFREGCKLRGLGWNEGAIYEALTARNETACQPPLDDEQVQKIARQAASHDPNPILETFRHSDVGNGQRLIALHGNAIRFSHEERAWRYWDDRRWQLDRIGRIERLAQETIAETHELADRRRDANLENWALETERRNGIRRMIHEAKARPGVSVTMDQFDVDPWLFNVRNGTLNLKTGAFLTHNPKDMITKLAPVDYDPDATAPTWDSFIDDVFDGDGELIGYVQRSLGYMLTGDTSEHAFWIAYGGGANGKSTLLNTVRKVLGDYGATTPFTTFDADNRNQYGNDMAALKGRRGVVAIEAEQDRRIAEARVKSITGGDPISCRFLYGEYFEYQPQFKVWLAVNHKPTIRGTERGIWRRIKLIPFARNFEDHADKQLPEKLGGEFPGILNWLLEGLQSWQENGLMEPQIVKVATDDYRKESDSLGQWIEEQCERSDDKNGKAADLYQNYRIWSEDRGEGKYTMSHKAFSIQLTERGFTKKREEQGIVWRGLALAPTKGGIGKQG